MKALNIYIDFDDVISETAREFSNMVERLFDKKVPYEEIHFFDLQKSFGLNDADYDALMIEGHLPEVLLSFEETKDAALTINSWVDAGHNVRIVTGRPFSAYEPSRQWLDTHGLSRVNLLCVNKYGRESFNKNSTYSIELDEFYNMTFDFAVEDSPVAFEHLKHFDGLSVAVFERPWNIRENLPDENYRRCKNWKEIDSFLKECCK